MPTPPDLRTLKRAAGVRLPTLEWDFRRGYWPDTIGSNYTCPACEADQSSDGGYEDSDWWMCMDDPLRSFSKYECGGGWWVVQDEDGRYWWVGRCGEPMVQREFVFTEEPCYAGEVQPE